MQSDNIVNVNKYLPTIWLGSYLSGGRGFLSWLRKAGGAKRLSPFHEGVDEEGTDGVDVVFRHFPDILEHKAEGFENAVLDVQLGHAVLVHQGGKNREGRTRLRHDGDGYRRTHSVLPLLHLQVVQQRRQHVVRA